jgi:hypothetical protein
VKHVAYVKEKRNIYRALVGKLSKKRPCAKPRCKWEDNFKIDVK